MCETFGVLPFEGGVLEQPLGLMVVAMDMIGYAHAYYRYESATEHNPAPSDVKTLVMETLAASLGM